DREAASTVDFPHASRDARILITRAGQRAGGRVAVTGHVPDVNVVAGREVHEVEVAVREAVLRVAGVAAVRNVEVILEREAAERREVADLWLWRRVVDERHLGVVEHVPGNGPGARSLVRGGRIAALRESRNADECDAANWSGLGNSRRDVRIVANGSDRAAVDDLTLASGHGERVGVGAR